MSKLGATALMVALGYLLFRILVGLGYLLYLICKMAVLLPIVLVGLIAGNVSVSRTDPDAPAAGSGTAVPAPPAPELGPATIESTGDWRQDRETLKQLLAEGKIK